MKKSKWMTMWGPVKTDAQFAALIFQDFGEGE